LQDTVVYAALLTTWVNVQYSLQLHTVNHNHHAALQQTEITRRPFNSHCALSCLSIIHYKLPFC